MLNNVEINWSDPSLGTRLRAAYFKKRGLDPRALRKHISPEVIAREMRRFRTRQIGDLMRNLFEAGRLDQYRLRRV